MNDERTEAPADTTRPTPWVELRSAAFQTFIYKRMVGRTSSDARPGDCVTVYDRRGDIFGHAFYNPKSQIALRMLNFESAPPADDFWTNAFGRAVSLRTNTLQLDQCTDAYRLIHAEGDDLTGLIVDRYADVLSVEIFSLGMWRRIEDLLPILHQLAGTKHHRIHVDERVQQQEGFAAEPIQSDQLPKSVNITENGVRFRVQFDVGHKTGFFCDQRENRRRLATMTKDASMLDVCSYTGGFGVYAKTKGQAKEVTCIDLDENAIELARKNANLNQVRISTAHSDAFGYMRQMHTNQKQYEVVVLDPPKLIFGRNDARDGRNKYMDLNRLAASLVKPGGILLTCSCSGAMGREDFVNLTITAARQAGRNTQILDITGAASDHPISPRCPESAYLKAVWLRLH